MKVFADFSGNKRFDLKILGHKLATDLGTEKGGADSAPGPLELFAASFATCVGYYALGYLATAKFDASGLSVEVDWNLDEKGTRIASLHAHVKVPNADLGERKHGVLAAMEKCIVHNTLKNYPDIKFDVEGKS